jgi:hypothetical protein
VVCALCKANPAGISKSGTFETCRLTLGILSIGADRK